MATLHLTLKKKWFNMIASGEKKEEYREIKTFWINRFTINDYRKYSVQIEKKDIMTPYRDQPLFNSISKDFDKIIFRNGYASNAPEIIIECLGIEIGKAKPEWSDNWQGDVFIIKLGKIISQSPF